MEEKVCKYCGKKIEEDSLYCEDNKGNCFCSYDCFEKYYENKEEEKDIVFNMVWNSEPEEKEKRDYVSKDNLVLVEDNVYVSKTEENEIDLVKVFEEEKTKPKKTPCPRCAHCGKPIKKGHLIYIDKKTGKYYCTLKCLARANGVKWESYKRV